MLENRLLLTSSGHSTVSIPSGEAEYVTMGDTMKVTMFTRNSLTFMVPDNLMALIRVFENNQGVMKLASNPLNSARTKHIDVQDHFLRELVVNNEPGNENLRSEEQHADRLTKALSCERFLCYVDAIMNSAPEVLMYFAGLLLLPKFLRCVKK